MKCLIGPSAFVVSHVPMVAPALRHLIDCNGAARDYARRGLRGRYLRRGSRGQIGLKKGRPGTWRHPAIDDIGDGLFKRPFDVLKVFRVLCVEIEGWTNRRCLT